MEKGDTPHEWINGPYFNFNGATINNMNIFNEGDKESHSSKKEEVVDKSNLSDEQVARAIEAVCGEGKPVDNKKKWAAVYWCLRWYCKFPVSMKEFCNKVRELPFTRKILPECNYDSMRKCTISLLDKDSRILNQVMPNNLETADYYEFAPIVRSLAIELDNQDS